MMSSMSVGLESTRAITPSPENPAESNNILFPLLELLASRPPLLNLVMTDLKAN